MPESSIKFLMDAGDVSESEAEQVWNDAKEAVKDQEDKTEDEFTDQDWGLVMHIAKQDLGIKESKKQEIKKRINETFGESTSSGNIAAVPQRLRSGKRAKAFNVEFTPTEQEKFVIRLPDGSEKIVDSMQEVKTILKQLNQGEEIMQEEDYQNEEENMNEDENVFYGVRVDGWHMDGDPVFDVDPEDYSCAVDREPETTFTFNDDRLNKLFRNSNYQAGISIWLRRNDDDNRKYKFIKPKSWKRQVNSN